MSAYLYGDAIMAYWGLVGHKGIYYVGIIYGFFTDDIPLLLTNQQ